MTRLFVVARNRLIRGSLRAATRGSLSQASLKLLQLNAPSERVFHTFNTPDEHLPKKIHAGKYNKLDKSIPHSLRDTYFS